MVVYSECFGKKEFKGKTRKESYLKATKWVALNIISGVELKDIMVRYEVDDQYPTTTIYLYAGLDEKSLREKHCRICKEMHHSFFIDENCNCDWCTTKAYQRRTDDMLKEKESYYKEKIMKGK